MTWIVVVGSKRDCARLRFVFPLFSSQKRVPHLAFGCSGFVFAVIGFCHLLTATMSRLPDLSNSQRYMCRCTMVRARDIGNCTWCSALHRLTSKLDEKEVSLIPSYWQTYTQWMKAAVAVSRILVEAYDRMSALQARKLTTPKYHSLLPHTS